MNMLMRFICEMLRNSEKTFLGIHAAVMFVVGILVFRKINRLYYAKL